MKKEARPFRKVSGNMVQYLAPEVLDLRYTEKCDIWSVGVLAYELMSKNRPFDNASKDYQDIFDQIKACNYKFEGSGFR